MKQPKTLTPAQAALAGKEYRALLETAMEQLNEHKLWLVVQLNNINPMEYGLSPQQHNALIDSVAEMSLAMVRVEPALKDDGEPTVSTIYDYPDALFELLCRIPALNPVEQGGIAFNPPS